MSRTIVSIAGIVCMLIAQGCASAYKSYSSGQIGCTENDIEITDLSQGVSNETWKASCKGKTYICSRTGGLGTVVKQVSCKEAQ